MDSKVKYMTKALKSFDSQLFAKRESNGNIHIYRWAQGQYAVPWINGGFLTVLTKEPSFIFALTDDWSPRGKPIDAGVEYVLHKLRFGDLHNRDLVKEMEEADTKTKETAYKHLQSETEAFAKDFRRMYAKMTDGINTSTLNKNDPRRLTEV